MKDILVKVEKNGETKEGIVILPEDLAEAIMLLGEEEVYKTFKTYYLIRQRNRIRDGGKKRDRTLKFKESQLTPEQKAALIAVGLL